MVRKLFIAFALMTISSSFVFADEMYLNPERVLEQGLISLRRSVHKLKERNERLVGLISELRNQLPQLTKQLEAAEKEQSVLTGRFDTVNQDWDKEKKAFEYAVSGHEKIGADLADLSADVEVLDQEYNSRQKKWSDVLERTRELENDIDSIRKEISKQKADLNNGFVKYKEGIVSEKQKAQRELQQLRQQWQTMNVKSGGILDQLKKARFRRNELNQQITILNDELKIMEENNKSLTAAIDSDDGNLNSEMENLSVSVEKLKKSREELKKVLAQATQKIGKSKLDSGIQRRESDEIQRLEQNIAALRRTQEDLKSEKIKISENQK